jgi:hypothetical protein
MVEDFRVVLFEEGLDGQNGLGVDLTDAGFSDAKGLRNFAQPQVLEGLHRLKCAVKPGIGL